MNLGSQKCVPCEGSAKPLVGAEINKYLELLKTPWVVIDNLKIKKEFKFSNFRKAIAFVNQVSVLAESEGHHPDIQIHYNKVVLEFSTHAINGLSINDFVMAFKIDSLKID